MYSAYFDASGNHDALTKSAAYYVCGFVASAEKWQKAEGAWYNLLDEYEMPQPFRMAEFMARDHAFKNWSGDDARRDAFRLDVAKLTHRWTNKPCAVGVVNADLGRMFEEYDVPASVPRQPYPWCALRATDHLVAWAFNRVSAGTVTGKERMEVVFEHGDRHQDVFAEALWKKHQQEVDFRTNRGKKLVPFAVCDWLAWELRNFMTKRERGVILLEKARSYVNPDVRRIASVKAASALIAQEAIISEIARRLPNDSLTYANWPILQRLAISSGWHRNSGPPNV